MYTKSNMLDYYRKSISDTITKAQKLDKNNKKSNLVNKKMKDLLNELLIMNPSPDLNYILMAHYTYYIVMLESRNAVWKYDYMAFSRRIGELWEPFCKLAFEYANTDVKFYEPESYDQYKLKLSSEINEFISSLDISDTEVIKLKNYTNALWGLSESGAINLKEDLHFIVDNKYYVVDFKSGFSSNEKGNVNRLLQVGKIYSSINYECLIFVRQNEEENNHYLQTLKHSKIWDVYCSDETYEKIFSITGVDLKTWMKENMNWGQDISKEFKKYLIDNKLMQYLTW
ncbi:MAG: hypothetical protein E7I76_03260 [Anaerococcus vaginalis]|uniref:hypothetical protein n=1 Tax=Anaerococcus vaginalis TaxID=33037 RepID=UPI001D883E8D|nr:hypothetical protein [Anaerococcus vaginalis]MBS4888775.1 hypothetical protein [Anaerococcus vaginalis]MDU4447006.1 hypothetical protein [Anaerococcus vaginalis]MDU6181386.1 hypothetical protein [Anaerococcus vaginalis]MDU7431845.1 hypothetical protein [Anaerococcus vaginalis]